MLLNDFRHFTQLPRHKKAPKTNFLYEISSFGELGLYNLLFSNVTGVVSVVPKKVKLELKKTEVVYKSLNTCTYTNQTHACTSKLDSKMKKSQTEKKKVSNSFQNEEIQRLTLSH